jgi:hypothetical protein
MLLGCDTKLIIKKEFNPAKRTEIAVLGASVGGKLSPALSKRVRTGLFGDTCISYGEVDRDKQQKKLQDAFSELKKEGFSEEVLDQLFPLIGADGLIYLMVYNYTEKAGPSKGSGNMKGMPQGPGDKQPLPPGSSNGGHEPPPAASNLDLKTGLELLLFQKGDYKPVAVYRTDSDRSAFNAELDKALSEFKDKVLKNAVCAGPPAGN